MAPAVQSSQPMVAASTELVGRRFGYDIERVDERVQHILGDQDAATYAPVRAVTTAPGKRVRAALALLCADAVSLPPALAIELAAGVELVHAFSLVHDDIEDDASIRRGRPSVHVVEGLPIAINAGDALHALSWSVFLGLDAPERCVVEVAQLFGATLQRVVAGQARDLLWTREGRRDVTYEEYVEMVRGKTGALLGFAAAAPAALNGHPGSAHLYRFGEQLGIAFQLLDDVAGLRGASHELGKPVGPATNGAASGPAVLASHDDDGVDRAIVRAHEHVACASVQLENAGFRDTRTIRNFAVGIVRQLLARHG